jgi:hypothetical protein
VVEEGSSKCAVEAAPRLNTHISVAVLELPSGIYVLAVPPVLEADEERPRAVAGDGDVAWLQPELFDDGVLQIPGRGTGWDAHGPGDERASFPVAQLAFHFKGGGDVEVVFRWAEHRVPHQGPPCRSQVQHGGLRRWRVAWRWRGAR